MSLSEKSGGGIKKRKRGETLNSEEDTWEPTCGSSPSMQKGLYKSEKRKGGRERSTSGGQLLTFRSYSVLTKREGGERAGMR